MSYDDNDDGRAFEREQERELGRNTMRRIMNSLIDEDGNIFPHVAIPSLLYVAGYLITKSLKRGDDQLAMDEILQNCVNDIVYAMTTSAVTEIAEGVINKAKGE